MYKYWVDRPWKELHVDHCIVVASSEEEALEKMRGDDFKLLGDEYIDTVYDEPVIIDKEKLPPQPDKYDRTLEDIMKESETDSSDN